ncbi:hypothetical protein PUMCH_003364 [Australozyma saopauloensis]|uniref:SWR1-complex protein 5 n=1 Tax=Australozyma saopauloensis TaxID=291208 RepID=A0AAX4HC71_9ASCO|nr:hypothetical protein PUMCH_003364 [[Candida] saopauloensis]
MTKPTNSSSADAKNGTLKSSKKAVLENAQSNTDNTEKNESDDDYDEENDDDYDPSKAEEKNAQESSDDEDVPDYSAVSGVSQVKTRGQIYSNAASGKSSSVSGLVQDYLRVDVDALFGSLENDDSSEWRLLIQADDGTAGKDAGRRNQPTSSLSVNEEEEQIRIVTTYTFAGRLVRESKLVAADSAEARAYLNSTSGLMASEDDNENHKSSVTVLRKVQGTDEERPLRIKLKRSSLIDKFLARDKKNKLTTLEKSRLDWASFVDKKKIKDDLAQHNKGGYLEKQAFLDRVENNRDLQYQQAKDLDRQQQWQQLQKAAQ